MNCEATVFARFLQKIPLTFRMLPRLLYAARTTRKEIKMTTTYLVLRVHLSPEGAAQEAVLQ